MGPPGSHGLASMSRPPRSNLLRASNGRGDDWTFFLRLRWSGLPCVYLSRHLPHTKLISTACRPHSVRQTKRAWSKTPLQCNYGKSKWEALPSQRERVEDFLLQMSDHFFWRLFWSWNICLWSRTLEYCSKGTCFAFQMHEQQFFIKNLNAASLNFRGRIITSKTDSNTCSWI